MDPPSTGPLVPQPDVYEYTSFPDVEIGGSKEASSSGYILPRFFDRVKSAFVGTGAASSAATVTGHAALTDSSTIGPAREDSLMTARTGASSSKRIAKPDVPRKQSRRANLTLDSESVASDRQPDPTSRRRQTALPYSLSNSAQTPSIGLSPISTAVVQHALPASAWSSGSRGGQTHAYQYPRPSSASSHYTNHHAGARLPYSPSLGHFDDRPGGDSDSGAGGPNFSHIPGFPLNLEILADDAGSIMSSSTRVRGGPAQTSEAASRLFRKMRGAGLSKDYWMPDEDAKECYDCGSRFTAWRRKHHCRICGQIYCSTCASNLIPGDRLYSSGYIRVCNICLARLDPDGDDAASEAPEESGQHSLAMSWTPSLPNLRRLAAGQRNEPIAEAPAPPPTRWRSRRPVDYVIHERDLSGNVLGLGDDQSTYPDDPWQDDMTTADLDSPVERSPDPNIEREAPPAPAPFRPAFADDDQPTVKSDDFATYAASVHPDGADVPASDANVLPESEETKSLTMAGEAEAADEVTDLPVRASPVFPQAEIRSGSEEPEDIPALMRKRVISRPLLPHLASHAASSSSLQGSDSAPAPPASFEKRDNVWQEAELTAAALAHLRLMVRQSLQREQIPHAAIWEKELLRLLAKVSRYPTPDISGGEPADIRRIVKVKRVPGGTPADSEYVDGVVYTKNVLHKQMPRLVNNPRVVLLGFSLDYERVEGRLTKLDTLLSQEKTWLRSNVDKVLKLRPSVVLVEGNVPGYAIELFKEANVAIARNVKPHIVQAIARCAQTAPNTMEKLAARPTYGHCGLYQVQTFAHSLIPGYRKTFMRFEGCPHELGATLVLRGGDLALLTRIKSIANSMVRIAYSLKLESYYLRDEGAFLSRPSLALADFHAHSILPSVSQRDQILHNGSVITDNDNSRDLLELVETIIAPYERVIMSGSPSVQIGPPRPLAQLRNALSTLNALRRQREADETDLILREEAEAQSRAPSVHEMSLGSRPPSPGISTATLRIVTEKLSSAPVLQDPASLTLVSAIADLEHSLPSQVALAESYLADHSHDLALAGHQKVVVQESVTRSDGKLCRGALLREMQFYQPGDQSVGQTIESLIACRAEPCPTKGCGEPKQSHRTHFVHGRYEATIWIHHQLKGPGAPEEVDATLEPGNEGLILMEGFCQRCNGHTVKTKMSEDSWRFSFGKFLELCFHSPGLVTGSVVRRDTATRIPCTHDAHQDHIRHFFHRGYRVDLTVRVVNLYNVCLPPAHLFIKVEDQLAVRNDEYSAKQRRTNAYFASVRARIVAFNLDLVPADKQEKCREALAALQRLADADEASILSQLDRAYEAAVGTNGLRMNAVRKALIDKAVAWDSEFASFEIKYVAPADKDVRRLTSVQLRRLFSDPSVPASPERPLLQFNNTLPSFAEVEGKELASPLPSPLAPMRDPLSLPVAADGLFLPDLPTAAAAVPKDVLQLAKVSDGVLGHATNEDAPTRMTSSTSLPTDLHELGAAGPTSGPASATGGSSTTPSISGDRDDDHESDSTVVDGQERFRRFGVQDSTQDDRHSHSDASSEDDLPRHQRSRRPRPSGTIASLVSRFDPPNASPLKGESSISRGSSGELAPRPSLKRGKSEAVRSLRRPTVADGAISEDGSNVAKRRSRLPRLAASTATDDRTSSPGSGSNGPSGPAAPSPGSRPVPRRAYSSTLRRAGPTKIPAASVPAAADKPAASPIKSRTVSAAVGPRLPGSSVDRKGKESVRRLRQEAPEAASASNTNSPSSSPRLQAAAGGGARVSTIARHFDRMSRDADRDRQRRVLLSRPRRARPIGHAQSSVHAFSSLRAAVHEDSDSDDDADDEDEPVGPNSKADDPHATLRPLLPSIAPPDAVPSPAEPEVEGVARSPPRPAPSMQGDTQRETESSLGGSPPGPRRDDLLSSVPPSPAMTSDGFGAAPSRIGQWSDGDFSSSDTTGRNSIMKTLSSLWNYRGADWLPLEYPQLPSEHQSAENPVVIREDEPSSIIAYTLSSRLYAQTLRESDPAARLSDRGDTAPDEPREKSISKAADVSADFTDTEDALRSLPTKPMQFRFDLESCTVTCRVFFMHHFEALRRACISPEQFIDSLARCIKWDSSGGKSGQHFLKTKDDRFIIKGISKVELEGLTKFAPAYFEHVTAAAKQRRPSALAKIYGIFQISFVNRSTGKKGKLQVQITENLLADKQNLKVFDLKGLTRNRMATATGKANEVLLDGNYLEMCRSSDPMLVHETSLLQLQAAIFNDTAFLAVSNHMDYSLVVGIDSATQRIHVGIIDYLTPYGFNKRLETLVKEFGGTSKEAPTIVTPALYRSRFRSAMARYFTLSPDKFLGTWKPYLLKTDPSRDVQDPKAEVKAGPEKFVTLPRLSVLS